MPAIPITFDENDQLYWDSERKRMILEKNIALTKRQFMAICDEMAATNPQGADQLRAFYAEYAEEKQLKSAINTSVGTQGSHLNIE